MPWGYAAAAVGSYLASSSGKKSSDKGGGNSNQYVPAGLPAADTNWQNSNQNSYNLANAAYNVGAPAYDTSYSRERSLDWEPYLQRAGQAGQAYGQAGDAAMGQALGYGQQAQIAAGQQQQLYGAGEQVLNTAMDPQHALYDRTAQQVQDQVRAGQAARGLGNSAAGAGEEDQAMGNFNIDWQNNQLQRQATGLQADVNANAGGVNQGRLYGADQSAGLAAGAAAGGYYAQAGSVPMQAQQSWAGAPGAAAAQLQGGYANMQQGFAGVASEAIPYMNAGNGALATNWQNNYQTNRDASQMGATLGQAAGNAFGNWYNGSGGSGSPPNPYYDPNTGATGGGGGYAGPDMGYGGYYG